MAGHEIEAEALTTFEVTSDGSRVRVNVQALDGSAAAWAFLRRTFNNLS